MDLSIFATPEAWISLVTLIFLEIILGVDNIVFITITTDRLKESQQHIGRKLGLAGAFEGCAATRQPAWEDLPAHRAS